MEGFWKQRAHGDLVRCGNTQVCSGSLEKLSGVFREFEIRDAKGWFRVYSSKRAAR